MNDYIKLGSNEDGEISISLPALLDSKMLIQGNSGGGKSWLLRLLCERAAGKVPIIILDSEGEFASLREKMDALLVGSGGEIPTDLRSASLLVRKLIELQVSAIIDLYELKPHERREYVRSFLNALIELPRELWHPTLIVLDEAHKFCPEKGTGESVSTQSVIDLMSLGRKRGFAGILASQRFSKLHNDAIAETNNVFIGRTWLDADQKRAGDYLGLSPVERKLLRELKPGEFYGFGPAVSDTGIVKFTSDRVETTHPKAGERYKLTPPKASDAIKQIVAQLADLPQQAEEEIKDAAGLRARISELQKQLSAAQKEPPKQEVIFPAAEFERLREFVSDTEAWVIDQARVLSADFDARATKISDLVSQLKSLLPPRAQTYNSEPKSQEKPKKLTSAPAVHNFKSSVPGEDLPKGEKLILIAAAQYTEGVTREQLTILTGYKRSSRDAYVQRLSQRGYVRIEGGTIQATDQGITALGSDYEPLPTGAELRAYWLNRLAAGERALFEAIVAVYPDSIEREILSEMTQYKRSSRDAYLQRLAARKLIITNERRSVKASANLFT